MATLMNLALVNALTVLPLALLALAVSRVARRPALTHAVWVLVLLKFITPSLFNLPLTIEVPVADQRFVEPVSARAGLDFSVAVSQPIEVSSLDSTKPNFDKPSTPSTSRTETRASHDVVASIPRKSLEQQRLVESRANMWESWSGACVRMSRGMLAWWSSRPGLRSALMACWLSGSSLAMAIQLLRVIRFRRRMTGSAVPSIDLQEETQRLGDRLGLRRVPQILLVDAAISPMLWGCGSRARLLFPSNLADRLDENARATLLTHELAHYCRGDHWVRLLELTATVLFWWHPVVWWARHQIEESEEECCDAWVISEFPKAPRQYAEALLDTIDFLCESRQALPPVACGLGQAHFLRRRLTKIMRGVAPKALSQRIRFAIALIAAVLLPLQPFVFGSASAIRSRIETLPLMDEPRYDERSGARNLSGGDQKPEVGIVDSASTFDSASINGRPITSSTRRMKSGERVWSTAASPDGRFVVRATTARRVVLTDLNTNSETDLSDQRITAVAFSPDGEWFAAAGQDGRVTIWDSARGELLRTVLTHADVLRSIAVSPRGNAIAAGSRDGTVLMVDLVTGESLANLAIYPASVNCVRFSSDGGQLAVAVGDWTSSGRGEVALLNVINGQTVATLTCATSPGALTFASNEELIVGLWDGRTQLWNLVNRQVVGSAMADKNVVSAAAFSPDNPALREATFVAEEPNANEDSSPLAVLRELFSSPASPVK